MSDYVHCTICDSIFPIGDHRCPSCNAMVVDVCRHCGKPLTKSIEKEGIVYCKSCGKCNESKLEVRRGGFGEPYCSMKCYQQAGEEISARTFRGGIGQCAVCQRSVSRGLTQPRQCVFFPFRGQLLHICTACELKGKEFVKGITECCMCGKPLTL